MEFKSQKKRILPLILLVDTSGSMDSCINELNTAAKEMVEELAKQESLRAEIHISIITFGGNSAKLHLPLLPISEVKLENFNASGMTPLGGALKIAKEIIEDRNQITSDSYRPMVILMSDGAPNDAWEEPLRSFIEDGRSKKCERLSLGIGTGYIYEILENFSSNKKVFEAKDAKNIVEFFKFVTMTVKEKSISNNPNKSPEKDIFETLLKRKFDSDDKNIIKKVCPEKENNKDFSLDEINELLNF